ncbi:MAG: hypothetical protein E4G99_04330 [Anaerolineales bacterium]|nr:MAG: hypothetical protein E4G99_04330 [Anaerolineales bacterium]
MLSRKKVVFLALVFIVSMGAGLRLYGLDAESLWNDELESWRQSNFTTIAEVMKFGSIPDTHPPIFQIVLYFVIRYFGDSEVNLRLPSAISGILSIPAIFWLGYTLYSSKEGLIAAFLMAVLWVPVYYSQEARNYAFLILFSILSSTFWMLAIRDLCNKRTLKLGHASGYVLCALLACYTHYYGLLLVVLQGLGGIIYLFSRRTSVKAYIGLYAVCVMGYLPWIPSMSEQISHTQRISWIDPPKLTALPAFISFVFNRLEIVAIVVLLFYGFLLINTIVAWSREKPRDLRSLLYSSEFVLGYWLILPIAIVFMLSVIWTPTLTQRNLLISLPAAYLLLARAIAQLPFHRLLKTAISLAFGFLPLYHMIFIMGYYRYPYKEQFREVVKVVVDQEHEFPDAPVIGYARFPEYFNYYFDKFGSEKRVNLIALETSSFPEIQGFIEEDHSPYFWYIAGHTYSTPDLVIRLEERYRVIQKQTFQGASVWLFEES